MPVRCAAIGCTNERKKNGLSFFKFPTKKELLNKWIRAVGRKEFPISHGTVLCEKHFHPECLKNTKTGKGLFPGSVPSIFEIECKPKKNLRGAHKSLQKIPASKSPSSHGEASKSSSPDPISIDSNNTNSEDSLPSTSTAFTEFPGSETICHLYQGTMFYDKGSTTNLTEVKNKATMTTKFRMISCGTMTPKKLSVKIVTLEEQIASEKATEFKCCSCHEG